MRQQVHAAHSALPADEDLVQHMLHGQQGVVQDHPRPGVFHYPSDLISHASLVAMNRAVGANGFCLVERTPVYLPVRVDAKRLADFAHSAFLVMRLAVQFDHKPGGPFFPGQSGAIDTITAATKQGPFTPGSLSAQTSRALSFQIIQSSSIAFFASAEPRE